MRLPRLREIRLRALLTQEDLAERSGVAAVTINRLENGHTEARISTVRKLAFTLGVPAHELMGADEDQELKRAA